MKLRLTERTVSRMARKVRQRGIAGIKHGNAGRTPWKKKDETLLKQYLELYRTKYHKFNFSHALEMIEMHHDLAKVSYTKLGLCGRWTDLPRSGMVARPGR